MTTVMWFRRDLRISDNIALYHACKANQPIYCVFQVNPQQFIEDSFNHRSFFLALNEFKQRSNLPIHILFGEPLECFKRLKEALPSFDNLYFNEDDTGHGSLRDQEIRTFCHESNITVHSYQDHYLHGAYDILTKEGKMFKVFTPYYHQWIKALKQEPYSIHFEELQCLDTPIFKEDEKKFEQMMESVKPLDQYHPNLESALNQLNTFIQLHLSSYDVNRDDPYLNQTSHLSSYLRVGILSIRIVWHELQKAPESKGKEVYIKELCWREFYHMAMVQYPHAKSIAINEMFRDIEWDNNKAHFKLWKEGNTGFPIVDAAMRQLNQTGWMHNRMRMIVASFLVKDLLIDWRLGEQYFEVMLVDYDKASNIGGWQWAASTGLDAVPYFRVFNPTLQSLRFDKQGLFIKQYVSELKDVPTKYIHEPSKMPNASSILTYPSPIIDHKLQRSKCIQRYQESKLRMLSLSKHLN